jgi:CBS domain containing-hemolysin-like protein
MLLLLLYGLIALGFSFLCSVFEAVLLSVTPSFIAAAEQEGPARRQRTGRLLRTLKENIDRPLAAILTLNTIAHTAGAAGVGAQAQKLWGSSAATAAAVVMTLLILIASEIIPKTLGATYWRGLSGVVARAVRLLIWALYPFVLLAQGLTRIFSRRKSSNESTREELGALAELGRREGVLQETEGRILQSLLRFESILAQDVMTPRMVTFMLPASMTVREALERIQEHGFSRIPLYGRDSDDLTGYLLKSELLLAGARDQFDLRLAQLQRPIVHLSQRLRLPQVLEQLLRHREHMALVTDDFGGTSGILTLEDVVETLLGADILDETDATQDLRLHARERWRRRAAQRGLRLEEREEALAREDPGAALH